MVKRKHRSFRVNKLLLGTFAIGVVVVLSSTFLYANHNDDSADYNNDSSQEAYYTCVYSGGRAARCTPIKDLGACRGSYPLKGKDIKGGIDPIGEKRGATCEGFMDQEEYIFTKSGKFLEIRPTDIDSQE